MKRFITVNAYKFESYSSKRNVFRPFGPMRININAIVAVEPIVEKIGFKNIDEWLKYDKEIGPGNIDNKCEMFKVILTVDTCIWVDADFYDDVTGVIDEIDDVTGFIETYGVKEEEAK